MTRESQRDRYEEYSLQYVFSQECGIYWLVFCQYLHSFYDNNIKIILIHRDVPKLSYLKFYIGMLCVYVYLYIYIYISCQVSIYPCTMKNSTNYLGLALKFFIISKLIFFTEFPMYLQLAIGLKNLTILYLLLNFKSIHYYE